MYVLYNCLISISFTQPEDGHYQAPKHVVVTYVENTSYSTNIYCSVRPVHTLYFGYFREHNWDDETHDFIHCSWPMPVDAITDLPVPDEGCQNTKRVELPTKM